MIYKMVCVTPWGTLEIWTSFHDYGANFYYVEFAHLKLEWDIEINEEPLGCFSGISFTSLLGPEESGREIIGLL